tara:strand:+ start:73 stop:225 length:153 start_codon:yes stop_codon:yes gene_type:complete
MWLEYIMWIFWYGFIALSIFVTIAISCCVIGAVMYGFCSLMVYLNERKYK